MNVCYLTASLSRNAGGLQSGISGLARSSLSLDHKVFVLGVQDQHTETDIAVWEPVPAQAVPVIGPDRFSFAPGLNRKLQETNPDIVQLHGLWRYPSVATRRWHRQTGRPYIVHPHGMLDPWAINNSRWKKVLVSWLHEKDMLRNAACIRALCKSEAESIRKFGCVNPICIIPNGMDLPELATAKTENTNPPWQKFVEPGSKVLLFLSRIHPKKGLVNLLKAWAENQSGEVGNRRSAGWVLALAGWDEAGHEQELKRLATDLGLHWTDVRHNSGTASPVAGPCSVVFLGPQFGEAKTACYAHCDAFILPSFSEGLPMVILEAWAHGKPVIMTPECNLPEGYSAKAGIRISADPEGISDGLRRLFGMSALEINEMGQNGRRLLAEKFSWTTIANQLQAVCRWLVEGGTRPDCVSMD